MKKKLEHFFEHKSLISEEWFAFFFLGERERAKNWRHSSSQVKSCGFGLNSTLLFYLAFALINFWVVEEVCSGGGGILVRLPHVPRGYVVTSNGNCYWNWLFCLHLTALFLFLIMVKSYIGFWFSFFSLFFM